MASGRTELIELRNQIDKIDQDILEAISRRAELVERIWAIKRESEMPLVDPAREGAIFERLQTLRKEPLLEKSVETIFRCILNEVRPKWTP